MYKVIGFQKKNLKFQDGREVSGYTLYLTETRSGVIGLSSENIFISDSKLGEYLPSVGDMLDIRWNRWGKVEGVIKQK